jgi:hypothetical protein
MTGDLRRRMMPSKNSYDYYSRFLRCLRLYLEKKVEDRKKRSDERETFYQWIMSDDGKEEGFDLTIGTIRAAFEFVFDEFIKKAPSACMGADDWFDKFLVKADSLLCPGKWCSDPHCEHNNSRYPYNCSGGNLPYKCKIWKDWRKTWRSYPEKAECRKCRYYKPEKPYYPHDKACIAEVEKINRYKCYCRAKILPEDCPKKDNRQNGKDKENAAE